MPNFGEIVLILIIIGIVFGFGKVASLGSNLRKAKDDFLKGIEGPAEQPQPAIDITPEGKAGVPAEPKPGTKKQPIEEAHIEPDAHD